MMEIAPDVAAKFERYFVEEFVDILNRAQLEDRTTYEINGTKLNDKCVIFMNKDQVLGELGQYIFNELMANSNEYQPMLTAKSLERYCPKYPKLNDRNKALIWTIIMTTVAHFESSCTITSKAKGPNGQAYGYYQLHKNKEFNYIDKNLDSCPKGSSTKGELSTKCAMAMLNRQLLKDNGNLFSKDSYWDVLRPKSRARKADDIQRTLLRSSLCKKNTI